VGTQVAFLHCVTVNRHLQRAQARASVVNGEVAFSARDVVEGLAARQTTRTIRPILRFMGSYLVKFRPRVRGDLRYRRGFAALCSPETRALPLYLDSGAYRAAAGTVPQWSWYRRYCEAIELIRPDGAMAWDVVGNQNASFRGYDRLCRDGYAERVIPVWQAGARWYSTSGPVENGCLAASDPILRAYAERGPMVAIGGLVQGPCPRAARHLYLAGLVRRFRTRTSGPSAS
jgi:hypothetical protein